jgi:hypothetical protein
MERLKNWSSKRKRNSNFLNAGNLSAWSFSKIRVPKKRNPNFLNAGNLSAWSFSKCRVQKKKEL